MYPPPVSDVQARGAPQPVCAGPPTIPAPIYAADVPVNAGNGLRPPPIEKTDCCDCCDRCCAIEEHRGMGYTKQPGVCCCSCCACCDEDHRGSGECCDCCECCNLFAKRIGDRRMIRARRVKAWLEYGRTARS
jgi:hypothetical protein